MLNDTKARKVMLIGFALAMFAMWKTPDQTTVECRNGVEYIDGRTTLDADRMPKTCHR